MKKRVSKINKKKNRILNKLGMTYVELLCALSLLSLIVVMFTPMLLSSYENLYKAGETVEKVYDSKQEIEEGLATRFSEKTVVFDTFDLGINDLKTNADLLFEAINVNGKKIVSHFQQGLETVFGNARASVDIISPKIVYDDKSNHDVMIQTTGIEYSKVLFGSYTSKYGTNQETADAAFLAAHKANIAAGGKGVIFIEVMIPDKSKNVSSSGTTTEEAVYLSTNIANLQLYKVENMDEKSGTVSTSGEFNMLNTDNYGRIKFNISGRTGTPLDFTQSPIKINVYYINPREQVKEVSDYLIIDPPTMIFAGDTSSSVDYYTSAGVQEKDGTYTLELEARKMRVDNSGLLSSSDTPGSKGARIQTITWVQEDENEKLKPYYVMAGTDSSVYRMYNYRVNTTIDEVFGISGATDTPEGSFILSDGSVGNPSFWSGEMSDQYSFHTMYKSSTYGAAEDNEVDCSAPQTDNDIAGSNDLIGTQYNKFDKKLRYSMLFSSFSTGYTYASQMSRKISYTLTEVGNKSFRIAGKKYKLSDLVGYHVPWEPENCQYVSNGFLSFSANTDDERACYFAGSFERVTDISYADNAHTDRHMAFVRLNSYTNVNPLALSGDTTTYSRFKNSGDFWSPYGKSEDSLKDTTDYRNYTNYAGTDYSINVNVTSSVYLPGSGDEGQGQVIYFGTVPSYALAQQRSDVEKGNTKMYNTSTANDYESFATVYLICGTQGEGTTIYKNASKDYVHTVDVHNVMRDDIEANTTTTVSTVTNPTDFYTKANDGETYKYVASDLEFTFGYCSRWRMTVGDVTFNGTNEETKSYQKYYTASNTDAGYTRKPSLNAGGLNNLYYDVWFPGEYYNLTHVATLDEITVAVGYTVSGSTFMEQSFAASGYYGTALGSVYNDAVLAAYISEEAGGTVFRDGLSGKGEQNAIFQNLLYYKTPAYKNGTDTTVHERENVRFTAVDLVSYTDTAGNKTYMAVYGDNHGKLYFSSIATSTVTNTSGGEGTAVESNVNLHRITTTPTANGMTELTYNDADPYAIVGTNSLSTIFSEITSIEASEDMVIVTGPAKDGGVEQFVILERPDPSQNSWTMKRVYNGTFKGVVNNAMILGDYYYIAGDKWVAAVSLDTLKNTPAGGKIANRSETDTSISGTSTNNDHLLWVPTSTNIYALGGRLTEG